MSQSEQSKAASFAGIVEIYGVFGCRDDGRDESSPHSMWESPAHAEGEAEAQKGRIAYGLPKVRHMSAMKIVYESGETVFYKLDSPEPLVLGEAREQEAKLRESALAKLSFAERNALKLDK